MADTIVISKVASGTILVNNGGTEYNLLPTYRLQKVDGLVQVVTDLGGVIETFDPVEVEKVVLANGDEVAIPDAATLFVQLYTNFFNASALSGDFFADVSKGLIAGHKAVVISGAVTLANSGTEEDVWGPGGTAVYPAAPETLNIVSSSGDDALAGSGARTIRLTGLGLNDIEQTEVVDMDGANIVASANQYLYPPVMEVLTAGGDISKTNLGDITATTSVSDKVLAKVFIGVGISKNSHYTVPAGKSLLVIKAEINATRLASGQVPNIALSGMTRGAGSDPDAAWIRRTIRAMDTSVLDQLFVDQPLNPLMPEGSLFRVCAVSDQDDTNVRVRTYAILIDD